MTLSLWAMSYTTLSNGDCLILSASVSWGMALLVEDGGGSLVIFSFEGSSLDFLLTFCFGHNRVLMARKEITEARNLLRNKKEFRGRTKISVCLFVCFVGEKYVRYTVM